MQVTGLSVHDFRSLVERVSADDYDGNLIVDDRYTAHSGNRFSGRIRTRVGGIGPTYEGASQRARNSGEYDEMASGARRSWSGRRAPIACWHAYRDVLAELFIRYPDARVQTSMATYRGAQGFLNDFPDTAYKNIGSMMSPATMPDLCDCGYSEGNYVRRLRERITESAAAS